MATCYTVRRHRLVASAELRSLLASVDPQTPLSLACVYGTLERSWNRSYIAPCSPSRPHSLPGQTYPSPTTLAHPHPLSSEAGQHPPPLLGLRLPRSLPRLNLHRSTSARGGFSPLHTRSRASACRYGARIRRVLTWSGWDPHRVSGR